MSAGKRRCKCRLCDEARRFGGKRPPRCPKCGLHPKFYDEILNGFSTRFDCDPDSGRIDAEGTHHEGYPVRVKAQCGCGYRWTVRGAIQITNIAGCPEY